jgi:hydroxypyruvate reductase
MAPRTEDLPAILRRSFLRAVRDFDVAARVRSLLGTRRRGRVLAVGKAASAMLAGAWDASVERALLVVPTGTRVAWAGARVDVRYATHPEPSDSSVEAGEAAFAFAREGIDLALISGGTSALLAAPATGLTLARKVEVTSALSNAGVPIKTLNLVRRHLSSIKGGGLARVAGRPILSVLLSDVLEGGPQDVGSGPTVADPTTEEDARRVLDQHGLVVPVVETMKSEEATALGLETIFVATPHDIAAAAVSALEQEGFEVHVLPSSDEDAAELAKAYAGLSRALVAGQALVRAAEPSVKVSAPKPGKGGRSTHLAALAARDLDPRTALLCGATDGLDGSSESAGAVVTAASLRTHDVAAFLTRFDTARLHRQAGTLIEMPSATGLNLCDLHILAKA